MSKSIIKSPHDKLFRAAMQYPEVAREFLDMHLPEFIKKDLDFSSIIICPNTFVDEDLKLLQSDVLLKALVSGQETYLYILAEHQSKPDPLMPFRLIQYMSKIWDFHIKQSKRNASLPLPVILPLIFFTGNGKYTAAHTIWDLCGEQSDLMQHIWTSPFPIVDVNTIPDEALQSRVWSGTLEFIMRNRFRQHLTAEFKKIAPNINQLINVKNNKLVVELLRYIINLDEENRTIDDFLSEIHDQVPVSVEEKIMSMAQRTRDEARLEGELKGKLEIAQNMLDLGSDPVFIQKITKLPLDVIKELQNKK